MPIDSRSSHETKLAMFRAALAAQWAGEPLVTADRIVASLLRTSAISELCASARIDLARLLEAADDLRAVSFEECERGIRADLAATGVELLSKEHQAGVTLRPFEPAVKGVFDAILERHGQLAIPPRELLLDLLGAQPTLAERLASHGLTVSMLGAAVDGE